MEIVYKLCPPPVAVVVLMLIAKTKTKRKTYKDKTPNWTHLYTHPQKALETLKRTLNGDSQIPGSRGGTVKGPPGARSQKVPKAPERVHQCPGTQSFHLQVFAFLQVFEVLPETSEGRQGCRRGVQEREEREGEGRVF